MAETMSSPSPIRSGATRANVYNEGLVVYLYDPANRDAIIAANGAELIERALDGRGGEKDKAVKVLAKQAILTAYELQQDDELVIDVAVGPPLTKEELKAVKKLKWHKPQLTVLDVPSGRLAVQSPNSSQIHPDEAGEEGAEIAVPAGRYLLSLHRVKWEDMVDEVCQKVQEAGVGQVFIVLTPLDQASRVPKTWPLALPFPRPRVNLSWLGKYQIAGSVFTGQIWFWDYWEIFLLNLDRQAFTDLGLGFGSVLDIAIGDRRFTVVYLNDHIQFGIAQLAGYKFFVGSERTLAPVANEPELALATWRMQDPPGVEILACMRIRAAAAIDQELHEKWRKAVVTVRPQRLIAADAAALGHWSKQDGTLQGEVLLITERYLSVNFDAAALSALGAQPGDRLLLGVDGQTYAMTLYADMKTLVKQMQQQGGSLLSPVSNPRWDALKDEWIFAADDAKPAIVERMRQEVLPDPPLAANPDKHWYTPDQGILLIQPAALDRQTYGLKFTLPMKVVPGTPVTLRKG